MTSTDTTAYHSLQAVKISFSILGLAIGYRNLQSQVSEALPIFALLSTPIRLLPNDIARWRVTSNNVSQAGLRLGFSHAEMCRIVPYALS